MVNGKRTDFKLYFGKIFTDVLIKEFNHIQ
jgi:hypothetical protein